jgi:hypothetical protein
MWAGTYMEAAGVRYQFYQFTDLTIASILSCCFKSRLLYQKKAWAEVLMLRKFMLRAKENEAFDKWWQQWISALAQNRIVVKQPSGNESGDNLEWPAEGTHKAVA